MNLYVGTSGYAYPEWRGSFYPQKFPSKQMLPYYAERLPAVESNFTFRLTPDVSVLKEWASQVPKEFRFALKAPQQITHRKRLKDVGGLVADFAAVTGVLKRRLGPVLYQLPPNFKKDVDRLRAFLKVLPVRRRSAVEFRHSTWFDEEVFELLSKKRVALCVAEADGGFVAPRVATADWGYVRLRKAKYADKVVKTWAKWVRGQDWSDAYVFFMHEATGSGPKYAERFLELSK